MQMRAGVHAPGAMEDLDPFDGLRDRRDEWGLRKARADGVHPAHQRPVKSRHTETPGKKEHMYACLRGCATWSPRAKSKEGRTFFLYLNIHAVP